MRPSGRNALAEAALNPPLDVLLVDDDPHYLELLSSALARDRRLRTEAAPGADAALERVDAVDCVVVDHSRSVSALELLDGIREREPTLPFVLHASDPPPEVIETLHEDEWTDYQPKGTGPETYGLLARRIRRLANHRRTVAGYRRATAALESLGTAVALVDPDGTITYANRQYATAFEVDRESVVGSHWRERYPADEADRLATDAVPTATDGWRWTGSCACRRADGGTVDVQISLLGLDDGSLVFIVDSPSDEPALTIERAAVSKETESASDAGYESGPE